MKAIMVMYDSLNRAMLENYGSSWVKTPNFKRLEEHCVRFDNMYVGSMPCMPARRELHTGRPNFLHRSWGPLEPFDDSMPELLKQHGVYTHLVSDHQHYWEDGGCTYHTRYSSWEIARGQEGDNWKGDLRVKEPNKSVFKNRAEMIKKVPFYKKMYVQDAVNRKEMDTEEKTSQAVTFTNGLDFIERNREEDNWFLQIETFDPHEPFFTLKADKDLYPQKFTGDAEAEADWPPYAQVAEDEETVEHVRHSYAALVTKCDRYLGKVLDLMDKYNLWEDTMLIVNTDHGFLLGEHGWWGKTNMPIYNEIAHIPLFVYDPRMKELAGASRESLVQTPDLAATLLEFFNVPLPDDMTGRPLRKTMLDDTPVRKYAAFGYHGSQVDITDGRYVYMMAAKHPEQPVYEYTLMPTHMRARFTVSELDGMTLSEPFSFTKGCKVMRIKAPRTMGDTHKFGNLLFDLATDPAQENPIEDEETEERMKGYIREFFKEMDAPEEIYSRYGL